MMIVGPTSVSMALLLPQSLDPSYLTSRAVLLKKKTPPLVQSCASSLVTTSAKRPLSVPLLVLSTFCHDRLHKNKKENIQAFHALQSLGLLYACLLVFLVEFASFDARAKQKWKAVPPMLEEERNTDLQKSRTS